MEEAYGEDLKFYQLYTDYSWGRTQQASMKQFMTDVARWEQVKPVATPHGTTNYSTYLSEAQNSGVDVLILNLSRFPSP
ncbi:branched-chain amino acid ABC transporter substrate-binding protein [Haloferax mediterranei ATCC 33500]|uniref:ABC-type branched-chain amino acid transport system, substrate-binding protein n=1 Tax=Haloferax mediterranei (strain ATCC 33500 / DSM 1411 / JCM 8866 / NBRC 14739 / NCIMB 2177 / R-4) TaxID=523841 RepID=I3R2Y4_HALMT|nr:ABC-type branched-chain amino acid transport systems, substrate-binding protein [Haloferax mediterranei ATCC 33500]AHZ22032.1 branched-chain amino acid ABC transporter substrate-binding protein [Haloferax mediterranei ATCC 33500]EMA02131.1 ABC-type branched-chain amino acid transport system, substrate-binding protein [Haloferax mediterranei ATCC 33500]QCQ75094.1 branched-chain amino acid ABC transporter substrate-binding protein [Haloferax mediterranei ATCC 33500]